MGLDFVLGKEIRAQSFSTILSKPKDKTLADAISYVRDRQRQINKRKSSLKEEIEARVKEYKKLNDELVKVKTVLNLTTK